MLRWVKVQVTNQLPVLSNPLTAFLLVGAVNFEAGESSLKTFVGEDVKVILTARARLTASLHPLNTDLAEAVATTGDLVWLTQNQQAQGTITLNHLWRSFNKLTIKSSKLVSHAKMSLHLLAR